MLQTGRAERGDAGSRIATTCWECSTCCGALVTCADGRVSEVAPNPAHPGSGGMFCIKGFRGLTGVTEAPGRLLAPLRRVGARGSGQWREFGWDEAFDEMAERFAAVSAAHGPLAIAGATSGGYFSRSVIHALLLRSMGSPNWMINQDLCGGCRGVSDMVTGLAIANGEDIDAARTILVAGANPHMANPVQWHKLKEAKKRGARLVAIDPLRTATTDLADLWLQPRAGTDAAIALAMMHVLIAEDRHDRAFVERWCHGFDALAERVRQWPPARAAAVAGVPAERITAAARLYADGPSTFVSGHGIDAAVGGVQTFRAFHCLLAIAGNLDRAGGNRRIKRPPGFRNYTDLLHDPAFRLPAAVEAQRLGARAYPLWAGVDGWQKACHNPAVIEAILTGRPYPVRAMLVSGVNIAVTYPDSARTVEALRALDFLVVAAHAMNPTAAQADIVLPKTTTLEEEEISLQPGAPCLSFTAAVLPPRGQAKSELEIAVGLLDRLEARGALARRLVPWRTQREFSRYLLGDSGIDLAALERDGFARFEFTLGDFAAQEFRTPSKRVELYSQRMAEAGLDPLPDLPEAPATPADARYPLRLATGLREKAFHHSRFRDQAWALRLSPDPVLRIHPDTAAAHGVAAGDWVRIATPATEGTCNAKVALTDRVPPGMVVTGMGWWRPEGAAPDYGVREVNINAVLSYAGPYDGASGSPNSRDLACSIERIDAGSLPAR
ncbi:MAG: molybdopterin-dependent oxidoreductase [Burkholderiales bacterium]|nr:molybdopterin-dependent oxidoreductase [Burkholderiales bacterium]